MGLFTEAVCVATVAALWYKPSSLHQTLYPTAKDDNGELIEVTVNGEKAYKHCDHGIEVWRTGFLFSLRPTKNLAQVPSTRKAWPCPFATEVNDMSKPRFKIDDERATVNEIMADIPTYFDKSAREEWNKFFDEFPRTVDDIPDVPPNSFEYVSVNALPPCRMQLPSEADLGNHQKFNAESITYTNTTSCQSADKTTLCVENTAAGDIPIMKFGGIVCVMPNEDYLAENGTAFWLAKVEVDETPETDACGKRIDPASNDDELVVAWLGAADSKGVGARRTFKARGALPARICAGGTWRN
eukprot:6213793-Pleurochrysis_carterae.AAC.1